MTTNNKYVKISLLNNMKADLIKWNNLPINITGKINLFRIAWLPKFLYSFSVITITTLKIFFIKVHQSNLEIIIFENSLGEMIVAETGQWVCKGETKSVSQMVCKK